MALLTGGARDLPARQRTLRSVIDWSHGLLDPDEQRVFVALGVFAGGCDAPAAEAVCGASLDVLASLQDKSLLRREAGPGGEPRFGMLDTIREYALERLDASGSRAELEERHARHYAALADAQAEGRGRGGRSSAALTSSMRLSRTEWLDWVALERHNLGSALGWLVEHKDATRAVELVFSIWRLWVERGPLREGRDWTEKVLALPEVTTLRQFPWLLVVASDFPRFQGDLLRARALLQQAVAGFRAIGDPAVGIALDGLADTFAMEGAYETATAMLEESLALARDRSDADAIAHAINGLATLAFRQGDYSRMRAFAEEECAVARTTDNKAQLAASLHNPGEARRHLGQLPIATTSYVESLRLCQELADVASLAECIDGLADVAAELGEIPHAVRLWAASQDLLTNMGDRQWNTEETAVGIAKAKTVLGKDAFEEAWRVGQNMTGDDATAMAFQVAEIIQSGSPGDRRESRDERN